MPNQFTTLCIGSSSHGNKNENSPFPRICIFWQIITNSKNPKCVPCDHELVISETIFTVWNQPYLSHTLVPGFCGNIIKTARCGSDALTLIVLRESNMLKVNLLHLIEVYLIKCLQYFHLSKMPKWHQHTF